MLLALQAVAMSSALFNPGFAFSAHFDTAEGPRRPLTPGPSELRPASCARVRWSDGAPLSELSWPSSLAVVAVSFSGLFTFVFLMLACLCCKKGDVGFKEFDNTEGEEYQANVSPLPSPSSQHGPEVYILPLTEVSLPVSKQPGRSIQLLKSLDVRRHSLLYLKEIGHGWFGKVLLGEVTEGLSTTQVVVKELSASASVHETLQHPALLQCLAQCSEVTPYLLVMEFCPLGDLKSYLRGCQGGECEAPGAFTLQRMACEVAAGLLHLHKHNFIHSDLALRSCLLTTDLSVKIGDYGLSHSQYKEDYFVTPDQIWVPLRWIAPELIDEVHGNLLVVDQTKTSNVWSFGVTMWELFELGSQPYQHYSDRQVLTYAVKEQLLKLPKPQLDAPLAQRWFEVMQFCWLQPELRPSTEELHLLVTYLCAKGSCEAEEDFEQRWNTLKPNLFGSSTHTIISSLTLTPALAPASDPVATQAPGVELASSASSSFPLLEQFSEGFHSDTGDDLLTVTESVHGLNFEYKWEQARSEQPYCSSFTSGPLGQGNPHYQDVYYPVKGGVSGGGGCKSNGRASGVSPSYYKSDHPGVVPVLSAHSPSVSSEYYIRIEEPVECNINLEDGVAEYSPRAEAGDGGPSSRSWTEPSVRRPDAYWSAADNDRSPYDSDESPGVSLTRVASSTSPVPQEEDHCLQARRTPESLTASVHSEQMPKTRVAGGKACTSEQRPTSDLQHTGRTEGSRGVSRAISSPSLGFCDPYLEPSTENCPTVGDGYCDVIGPLGKASPAANHIIDVETEDGVLVGQRRSVVTTDDTDGDLFSEAETTNWTSNHSANNNSLSSTSRHTTQGSYLDLQFTTSYSMQVHIQGSHEVSESNRALEGRVGVRDSSFSLVELGDFSDDEDDNVTDITSGIFVDFNLDYAEVEEEDISPVKRLARTSKTVDALQLSPLAESLCDQAFSPDAFNTPMVPKSLDSGYDTENNGSPEFFFRELSDSCAGESSPELSKKPDLVLRVDLGQGVCSLTGSTHVQLKGPGGKNPYRDSAYLSDYDAENERSPQEEEDANFFAGPGDRNVDAGKMGGCLTKESGPAEEDLGLNTQHSEEEPSSDYTSSHIDSTVTDCKDEGSKDTELSEDSTEEEELPTFDLASIEAEEAKKAVRIDDEDFEDIDAEDCDSQDSMCVEPVRAPLKLSSSSSFLKLCGEDTRAPLEEEEDDSDDSESDEELRTYNIQEEESEESEDDFTLVPVVVSDCSGAGHLRSLLKRPTLLSQSFCDELERKKKAVSFFDDVTVFVFDQESPTGELSDYTLSTAKESSGQDSPPGDNANSTDAAPQPRGDCNGEDDSPSESDPSLPDGRSEARPSSASFSDGPDALRPIATPLTAVPLNRFSVSRFSITHVSDHHIGSPAGEDGDRQ
ncbi:hypothetical protein NHX12_031758 [Muraenolepis orangiensis]|uniref:non-specific serine/threonine protein kinase n=1 Tax=Muraenolepis orangiensis TaxID=630683 RepID=A0A9Q0E830_9TELE|nr:hypothetical protein NHX12_031758 [Muraenolepis orangiensis]